MKLRMNGMTFNASSWLQMIFQIIWKHQNPPDCSKAKFLIIEAFKSGMWLDDGSCMFDLTTHSHYICQASQCCDRCWLAVKLVSSFDKANSSYGGHFTSLYVLLDLAIMQTHGNAPWKALTPNIRCVSALTNTETKRTISYYQYFTPI